MVCLKYLMKKSGKLNRDFIEKNITMESEFDGDFIPLEIIENILTRLPVRSLCRFKCVSKPWLHLISSPRFVKLHLLCYSTKFPRIVLNLAKPKMYKKSRYYCERTRYYLAQCSLSDLLNNSTSKEEAVSINYPEKGMGCNYNDWVIGSCNGLLCISAHSGLILVNPSMRLCKVLPPLNDEMIDWISRKYQFVYDDNSVDDDYRVFCFYSKIGELQVNIFSWRANSWLTPLYFKDTVARRCQRVFFGGKIHYGTHGLDAGDMSPALSNIVSFDLQSGEYGRIEIPDYGDGVKYFNTKVLGGCFCLVCEKETQTDIWVMKEYGVKESWTKLLTISLPNYYSNPYYIKPVCMLPSGEMLVAFQDRFEVFNLENNSRRVLDTINWGFFIGEDHYVESLVSPTQHERMQTQEEE